MSEDPLDLYSDTAIDHAQSPRHLGVLERFNGCARITGPCGDTMVYWVLVENDVVADVSWVTSGCGSSRSAGSMTSVLAHGSTLARVESLEQADVLAALGGFPPEAQHCALLSANTLKAAVADYRERGSKVEVSRPARIAVPLAEGKLAQHFGHCEQFAIIDVDPRMRVLGGREDVTPPPHEPGLLPRWLGERGVNLIIAGGMGQRALALFAERGIEVVVGAPVDTPENLVGVWMDGLLVGGDNVCDH